MFYRSSIALASMALLTACGQASPAPGPVATGDPDPLAAPPAGDGFQVAEAPFLVDPGKEAIYCERYPLPSTYGSDPVFITGVESHLPTGTHHFFLSYDKATIPAATPCVGSSPLVDPNDPAFKQEGHSAVDGKLAFIAPVGEDHYDLAPGYALYLETGLGHVTTSHHVINFEAAPISMYGTYNVYTSPKAEVHHPANILNCLLRDISVMPHSEADLTATCTVPFDLDMIILSSHAHQFLSKFTMNVFDGQKTLPDVIYESTAWDSPKIVPLTKPLSLKKGQGLTFTCHYVNTGDQEVTYGAGDYKEMCAIMSAYAYPADHADDVPPSLGTIVYTEGTSMPLIDTSGIGGNF